MSLFIDSFKKYILIVYYVPTTVIDTEKSEVNKTKIPDLMELAF